REAVKAGATLPDELILMDVSMPEMDGLEATAEIRSLPGDKADIPIIALTAHTMPGDREKMLGAGMNDYLPKPMDRGQLLETISRWAGGGGLEPGADRPEIPGPADDIFDPTLLDRLAEDTDPEIVPDLIRSYLENSAQCISRIAEAVAAKDFAALELETHTLGSSSATFGVMRLYKLLRQIEMACRDGDRDKALSLCQPLDDLAEQSRAALAGQLKRLES
ncbi:MAG: response regulator, partial [Proteobacteria bacterium]|nr:response regulator [Pseudomonadota bacterium]